MEKVTVALKAEGQALSDALQDVSADELARVSNCPPWTVAELIVHTASSITMGALDDAAPMAVPREPADYYRRAERATVEYHERNVKRTQEAARRTLGRTTAAACFGEALNQTLELITAANLNRVVEITGVGPMRLGDWLISRVIAVAAHGLDVAISLNRQPWTTTEAREVMAPVYVSLLGASPPPELDWDDYRFFEVSTGRALPSDRERSILGAAADRFPLLS